MLRPGRFQIAKSIAPNASKLPATSARDDARRPGRSQQNACGDAADRLDAPQQAHLGARAVQGSHDEDDEQDDKDPLGDAAHAGDDHAGA